MNFNAALESVSTGSGNLPHGFPIGSEILAVVFTEDRTKGKRLLHALPIEFQTFAVERGLHTEVAHPSVNPTRQIEFLTIPAENHQVSELQNAAATWVDASTKSIPTRQMMTLQGAQIYWSDKRIAILAASERLETLRNALIETAWFDAELASLERELASAWPEMQNDIPLAFMFDEKSLPRRKELQRRFQQIVSIRARMLKLSSHVHCPHIHPPTLASQVAERFRERTRLFHRHEVLGGQLEIFEKVYDTCGQRISDFVQSRTGHILECIIIVLLVLQIMIWGFEILTTLEPTTVAQ